MAEEEPANVFAFPDFNLSTKWPALPSNPQDQFFNIDVVEAANGLTNYSITNTQPSHTTANEFFNIPDALALPDLNSCDNEDNGFNQTTEPLHDVTLPDLDIIDELWHKGADPPAASAEYKTWEAFSFPDIPQAASLFITEAGPLMYDATITDKDDPLRIGSTDHLVIQSNPYLAALLALTLGRASVFFVWDAKKGAFIPAMEKMRISGYSTETLQGLQNSCLRSGTTTRFLSSYVQLAYRTRPIAAKVALAKAVDVLLLAIQQQFGERGKDVMSLLQLQSLVEPVESMLLYLRDLVRSVSRMRTDEHVLSQIFTETETLENEHSLLRALMCEILSRVTEPWTDFAEKWIGVKAEEGVPLTKDGPGKSFVKVQNVTRVDDFGFETEEREYVLDETRMPNFISPDIALVMFEAGKTLRLLRIHHPEHPLCHIGIVASSRPPSLKWLFDWKSIENLEDEVTRYEKAMLQRIIGNPSEDILQSRHEISTTSGKQSMLQVFGNDGTHLEKQLLASIQALDQAPPIAVTQDVLSSLLENCLYRQGDHLRTNTSDFGLHWSLIPLHSFGPLVMSQARLINREYMKLLFNAHDLKEHLRVQKEFQLLGNGMFCSRLSHALFDPDLETAERRAGVALNGGIMGLRMNGRETWPPASSELRLALMGVLSDTYLSPTSRESNPLGAENSDLPGDLSFALRDVPPEEIDKCMDPSSLEALDFLRLAYKTPAPLSPILTTVILVKYDKIFKLLLRILRMLYVVGQLFRDTSKMERQGQSPGDVWLRFRFEAQHLVQSVTTYFFDTGIQMPWLQFERWLDGVESDLARVETDISHARVVSPDEVREEHEKMLDRIMTILLLRKRQQPVLALLEDIFKLILRFSRQVQLEVGGKVAGDASRVIIQELYQTFRKKMGVFVTVCHGLSEKGGAVGKTTRRGPTADEERQSDAVDDANTIDRLLLNLDMLGYYSRPRF
ncbi:Spc97/Spc98 family protein [Xylaria longipes]|nr:Spc97/Spc98 family protein [Xylaria longipes]